MRLKAGQQAPGFVVEDIYGRPVALTDYAGRQLMLSFYRSAACPLCNVRTWHLINRYPMYQRLGLSMVAFFESSPQNTHTYLDRLQCPFPVVADIERQVYTLFGLESSWIGAVRGLMRRSVYREAASKGLGAWRTLDNVLALDGVKSRLPADFLIGPDLTIRRAYYGKDAGDFLLFSEIDSFVTSAHQRGQQELQGPQGTGGAQGWR
jgi:peroxiredoxin